MLMDLHGGGNWNWVKLGGGEIWNLVKLGGGELENRFALNLHPNPN